MGRSVRVRLFMAIGLLALAGGAGLRTPDPGFRYAVTGPGPVALSAGPEPGSGPAGSLPAGTSGLVLTGRWAEGPGGGVWEVLAAPGDRPAWAPADRLAPGSADPSPAPLKCSGTEPFWGLETSGGRARMSRPGLKDQDFLAGPRRGATGDPRVFVQRLSGPGRTLGQLAVVRRPDGCSDGMSDLLAPYEAVVTTPSGEVLSGCCRRAGG
ncbi:COG3650 family protein [Phenylobacterium parvum]|uniref:Uncharacterized protein n=1 Tax=Phenylobacterium parvum TaxID=2201350 RepID=A0A2Z3HPX7_9CAUL|nr:hypothetical protein [Phenylobacterium parvum]AWM76855.1 hypothetical protein HYN04_03215 [Phenylobacterium parvum]